MFERLAAGSPSLIWHDVPVAVSLSSPALVVAQACDALAGAVAGITAEGRFPIVIGGDHSIAMGTWSGLRRALAPPGLFDLLWIDAHMDCHDPSTSPSGALHGMPLACLLGRCHPDLAGVACPGPPLTPGRVTLIGVRSFEPEETAFARRTGLRVVHMEEIAAQGLAAVMPLPAGPFGITLDLDAVDPGDAPAVGTPEPGGIRAAELLDALRPLLASPRCLALEIAEYSPPHDVAGRTAALMEALLRAAVQPGEPP
ncbi:arginase [Paramagnetospirillum caucaseum]|uniref:Arginase n=1 Tax=Paramagnetospirillum caucaseum TaxID=1244869 RepID=M2Z901_9PROT|nr:arginase [Paramagnetospirillum caucaseum]